MAALAAALAVGAGAVGPTPAAATASAAVTSLPSADGFLAGAPPAPPPGDAMRRLELSSTGGTATRHAGVEDRFTDRCEDATGAAPDLRRTTFSYDFDDQELTTRLTLCGPAADEIAGGAIGLLLGDDDTAAPRRRVVVEPDDVGFRAVLYDARDTATPGDDVEVARTTVRMAPRDSLNEAEFVFSGDDLGPLVSRCRSFVPAGSRTACFTFAVASGDGADGSDTLPEGDEPVLVFPDSCDGELFDQYAVRTEPGRHDEARAAARAAGLAVHADQPALHAFGVRAVRGDPLALRRLPGVRAVAPATAARTLLQPDDDAFGEQWQHDLTATTDAWDLTTGSSDVRVAIVDDGVDGTRHDLVGRVLSGLDTTNDRVIRAGANSDRGGHGTQVAGLLAATGNNGGGPEGSDIAGVDWRAGIVPIRIFDAAGCATDVDVAAGILAAVELGADVVNLSLGTPRNSDLLNDAVAVAEGRGAVLVAATGNDGRSTNEVSYPAAYPTVIAVGSSSSTADGQPEQVLGYSNTASDTFVVAPGGDGVFRDPDRTELLTLGDEDWFSYVSGTSFSAPLVSGAISLLRGLDRCLAPADVRAALAASAVPLASDTSPERTDGRRVASGWGRLDTLALLTQPGVGADRAPAASDLQVVVPAGAPRTFRLPVTPCSPDEELTASVAEAPAAGAVVLDGLDATYTPAPGSIGQDRFTFEVESDSGSTSRAVVTLAVQDQVRIRAEDRYATAAELATFAFTPGVPVAYVANGTGFPDALAASAAAGRLGGPVLLTRRDVLPAATSAALARLQPSAIVVVGGTAAVGEAVLERLEVLAGAGGVTRLRGPDRYATAVAVAQATDPEGAATVYVATGGAFPDALAGAPPAILADAPLLLTRSDAVPSTVAAELARLAPSTVVVLGGPAAITPSTAEALRAAAGANATLERLSGATRYATAAQVVAARYPGTRPVVLVATGQAFPDALAGGVVAARLGTALLLVPSTGAVPEPVLQQLDRLGIESVVVLGGTGAVSQSVAAQVTP